MSYKRLLAKVKDPAVVKTGTIGSGVFSRPMVTPSHGPAARRFHIHFGGVTKIEAITSGEGGTDSRSLRSESFESRRLALEPQRE